MKKIGFTIAEILITLAIIGIVAALTLPSFTANSRNLANASKLSTTISAIENAFASMMVSEGAQDMFETKFVIEGNDNYFINLGKYLKLSGESDNMLDFYDSINPFVTIDNVGFGIPMPFIYQMKNGALFIYTPSEGQVDNYEILGGTIGSHVGELTIDVNGSEKPNTWGRDVFLFLIGSDGILYPAGSLNYSILFSGSNGNSFNISNDHRYACSNNLKGAGCTARLIQNNFSINY